MAADDAFAPIGSSAIADAKASRDWPSVMAPRHRSLNALVGNAGSAVECHRDPRTRRQKVPRPYLSEVVRDRSYGFLARRESAEVGCEGDIELAALAPCREPRCRDSKTHAAASTSAELPGWDGALSPDVGAGKLFLPVDEIAPSALHFNVG